MYQRSLVATLVERFREPRRFIQVLAGPRQTGKTTAARQAMAACGLPSHYASADEPSLRDRHWLEQQWEAARLLCAAMNGERSGLLVLDEIQKIPEWSETVKRLWDEDTAAGLALHVVVLGSSPLLVQRGLADSLAGRFELIPATHWSFAELHAAFGWQIDQYVFYGGYPGAANLIDDPERWRRYILDSLIETTVSRDILLMTRVDKPALLRRLFELACAYSGQVLSYQKMLGQLQDAGNTTTLAHYLDLLRGAGLVAGLPKYAGQKVRRRASSPKLVVMNTGLMNAMAGVSLESAKQDGQYWGRLIESAVGAHLVNSAIGRPMEVCYWQSRDREVDFVLGSGARIVAIEVKSGRRRARFPGLEPLCREFTVHRKLLVGGDGISLKEFLETPVDVLVEP